MKRNVVTVLAGTALIAGVLTACSDEEVANRAPHLAVATEHRVGVGGSDELIVGVADPDDDAVTLEATGLPPGAVLDDGLVAWAPDDAGTWNVTVEATDEDGATTTQAVRFESRYPQQVASLVALGDSVASGHGLDKEDYLLLDDCWRSDDGSYGELAYDELGWNGGFELVACSGAETDDLPDQVEEAVESNPEVVTITIGANDLQFDQPDDLLTDDGTFDEEVASARLATLSSGLYEALDRLVASTDSTVVVTTYHNPTASDPHGIDGCDRDCFKAASDEMVDRLAGTISGTAARFRDDRVVVADVRDAFDDHGAGNGYGPDGIRAGDGAGPLNVVFDRTTALTTPYCSKGDPDGDPWVNGLDCVHPDGDGARAYADAVLAALDDA